MTWVLLRGLARESRHWGDFTQQLAASTGQAALALDLPGNGVQFSDSSPASVSSLLDALRHQIKARKLALPINVLAMSMGGMVATLWAQRYPQEVACLVLINTSMRPFSGLTERLRPGIWPTLVKLAFYWEQADQVKQIESTIYKLTCQQAQQSDCELAHWSHIRQSAPVSAANALRQLLAAARFKCDPVPPICPMLVLSAKGDCLVNPICSDRLVGAWQLRHHQHPWAGHDIPHDDGPWVCKQVTHWLTLK